MVGSEVEALNIEAERDWANCDAKADIEVDGAVLIAQAPSTFLLHLEKRLSDRSWPAIDLGPWGRIFLGGSFLSGCWRYPHRWWPEAGITVPVWSAAPPTP